LNFIPLFVIVLSVVLATTASAQTYRGSVRGTVFDPKRAAIAGARVTVTNTDTGDARTTTTDSDGEFAISSLPAGSYQAAVEMVNFQKYVQTIEVLVNQEQRLDVVLDIGGLKPLEVNSTYDPDLKKDSASLGTVIENRQITGLPLDGRNFYELSLLVPGAVPPAQGSAGSARGDFAFSVNGAREDANNFLLDGVYNVDPKLNTFGVRPSVEAIREFEMLTSTYDASFGRNPGAQVNVILNSGSNDFHGSAFEFHRNACARCAQLLRSRFRAETEVHSQPVWRIARWSNQPQSHLLLRGL
jgi:hypothetical protein